MGSFFIYLSTYRLPIFKKTRVHIRGYKKRKKTVLLTAGRQENPFSSDDDLMGYLRMEKRNLQRQLQIIPQSLC